MINLLPKTQEIFHKVVDDFLSALKFVPDWFVRSKMIKSFLRLCTQMMVYSFLMSILIISHFVVLKWVFLVQILIGNANYEEDDPDTIIFGRISAWNIEFQKHKKVKER